MIELLNVIRSPHLTEKSSTMKEATDTLCFRIARDANKIDVRRAVERLFDVKVHSVRVVSVPRKRKRLRNQSGFRPGWRKAYVRLKPGQKSPEYFEGI